MRARLFLGVLFLTSVVWAKSPGLRFYGTFTPLSEISAPCADIFQISHYTAWHRVLPAGTGVSELSFQQTSGTGFFHCWRSQGEYGSVYHDFFHFIKVASGGLRHEVLLDGLVESAFLLMNAAVTRYDAHSGGRICHVEAQFYGEPY